MQEMALSMGTGDVAEAGVLRCRVGQIVHKEDHGRRAGIGPGVLPHDTVLMPEQLRTARGLADEDGKGFGILL